ncbi:hypothetical protein Lser_V15G20468 [Lactuca serriola]
MVKEDGNTPVVTLFKSTTAAIVSSNPVNSTPFYTMSKQAEDADLLYKANLNTRSVLAFTSAAPKARFIGITTSKDFYCIFSGLQIEYLEDYMQRLRQTTMKCWAIQLLHGVVARSSTCLVLNIVELQIRVHSLLRDDIFQ